MSESFWVKAIAISSVSAVLVAILIFGYLSKNYVPALLCVGALGAIAVVGGLMLAADLNEK